MIFSFASPHAIATMLLQKNVEGHEQPIVFASHVLWDSELKYNILEKKAYALVKSLKAFRVYVLQSVIATYVPTAVVKDILVQGDSEGKRGKWIAKIQEYEMETNPTNSSKALAGEISVWIQLSSSGDKSVYDRKRSTRGYKCTSGHRVLHTKDACKVSSILTV